MKLVTVLDPQTHKTTLGRLDSDNTIRDLTGVVEQNTMLGVIDAWDDVASALEAADGLPVVSEPRLCAPIPLPRNLYAVGKNYHDHVREFGRSGYDSPDLSTDIPAVPVIFSKVPASATGPYDAIDPHLDITAELDYEAELAVIIGPGGRGIPREAAMDHVWGYTIINDVTARDQQHDHQQWLIGKSLDTFAPMGPYAVTADEVGDPTRLEVSATVNGELRQKAPVADLIFDIPELISTLSAGITLRSGDIIATGTPAGVGIGFTPPRFLETGDVVECAISGLGSLRNTVSHPA
ncbi:fumarylacetoacetate hydrolase family protein [Streptomyces sp. NPDC050546]|uniref:fumarylacetoacetate hydrolase family protein n=1 Tax=Streptomyces sp. NPDC050546 TaxID=3365628 RepID=UPI00379DB8FD